MSAQIIDTDRASKLEARKLKGSVRCFPQDAHRLSSEFARRFLKLHYNGESENAKGIVFARLGNAAYRATIHGNPTSQKIVNAMHRETDNLVEIGLL